MIRITLTSVLVDDQARALDFCTRVLGFVPAKDVPMGEFRWLTVVSPAAPDGPELLLEPDAHPAGAGDRRAGRGRVPRLEKQDRSGNLMGWKMCLGKLAKLLRRA